MHETKCLNSFYSQQTINLISNALLLIGRIGIQNIYHTYTYDVYMCVVANVAAITVYLSCTCKCAFNFRVLSGKLQYFYYQMLSINGL